MLAKLRACVKACIREFRKKEDQEVVKIPLKQMEGILVFTHVPFPLDTTRVLLGDNEVFFQRYVFGFCMAKTIVSLYMIEIMLKYAHQKIDEENGKEIKNRRGHNIGKLFRDLPEKVKREIGTKYRDRAKVILHRENVEVMPIQSLVKILKGDPITDIRYFWQRPKGKELPQYHNDMEAFGYGIAVGACDYPDPSKP